MEPVLLAALNFYDVLLIAAGLILGFAVINTTRWILSRRRRVRLPEEFLVEMSRFAYRFQRSAEQMQRLSKLMENPTRLSWKARNAEILRTLRQMNRLLQRLNDFFEEKIQDYEVAPHSHSGSRSDAPALRSLGEGGSDRPEPLAEDFSRPEEKDKFAHMRRLTESDIAATDWDVLLNKLSEQENRHDQSD